MLRRSVFKGVLNCCCQLAAAAAVVIVAAAVVVAATTVIAVASNENYHQKNDPSTAAVTKNVTHKFVPPFNYYTIYYCKIQLFVTDFVSKEKIF